MVSILTHDACQQCAVINIILRRYIQYTARVVDIDVDLLCIGKPCYKVFERCGVCTLTLKLRGLDSAPSASRFCVTERSTACITPSSLLRVFCLYCSVKYMIVTTPIIRKDTSTIPSIEKCILLRSVKLISLEPRFGFARKEMVDL